MATPQYDGGFSCMRFWEHKVIQTIAQELGFTEIIEGRRRAPSSDPRRATRP